MPHKRKKKSERDATTKESGFDNIPKAADLTVNSSGNRRADWILNSHLYLNKNEKGRKEEAQNSATNQPSKKRKVADVSNAQNGPQFSDLKIRPGEKLKEFNRRVEMNLQPEVAAAIRASKQSEASIAAEEKEARKKKKADAYAATLAKEVEDMEKKEGLSRSQIHKIRLKKASAVVQEEHEAEEIKPIKEFATATQVSYINDIAMAPPVFRKLPKGAVKTKAGSRSKDILKTKPSTSLHAQKVIAAERERVIELYRQHKNKIWESNNQERDRQAALDLE